MGHRMRMLAGTSLAASLVVLGGGASAQEAVQIDEVIVTARKTSERLQEVPLAITAMNAEEMQRRGVRDVTDLSSIAPGLNIEKDQGRRFERPVIRGQANVFGSPNVASFIDGVYIPDSLFATEMAFVEQVEVIKGPQSALYGRQTFAGAISYTTRRPSNEIEALVRATAAEHDEYNFLMGLSGPLVQDVLSAQASVNYYTYGGEYRNNAPGTPSDGKTIGSEKTVGGTLALLYTPTPDLSFILRGSYAHNDDGHEPMAIQRSSANNCYLSTRTQYYCGAINVTPEMIGLNLDEIGGGGVERKTGRVSLTAEYDHDGYTLTSISAYNDSEEHRKADLDFLPLRLLGGSLHVDDRVNIKGFSQEVRIASPRTERLHWMAGAYYFNSDRWDGRFRYITRALQNNGTIETENLAAFGLVGFDFTDKLSGTAEVRVAEEKLHLTGGDSKFDYEATYRSTNPRFTLSYKATDDLMFYGLAARGNKPGGFNTDVRLSAADRSYGEETAWNYELGFKSDLFDRRVRLNVASYYIDWSNQQMTQVANLSATETVSFIRNVGEVEVKGVEVEAQTKITADWSVRGTFAYADSEYTNATDPDFATLSGGNGDVSGKAIPNAPKIQYSLGSNYAWYIGENRFFVDGTYSFRSKKYDQVANLAWVDGRDTANVQLGWEHGMHRVILFGRNIFDNIDPVGIIRYSDFTTNRRGFVGSLPRGRQIGLTYEANF